MAEVVSVKNTGIIARIHWQPTLHRRPLVAAVALALSLSASATQAATIQVETNSDGAAPGLCRLRDAIQAANDDAATGDCIAGSGPDIINLLRIAGSTITLSGTRLPTVTSGVTLQGESVTVDGNGLSGLMAVSGAGANLNISYLSLVNGNTTGTAADNSGGALRVESSASLTITGSTISGNTATQDGGGIAQNSGVLALTNSTVSGNTAGSNGGGIHTVNYGTATLVNSTLSGNSAAANGGGLFADEGARVFLTNATLSGNTATTEGGGVFATYFAGLRLVNSIIANSSGADCSAVIPSGFGLNLIEDGSCLPAGPNRLIDDPGLLPLSDNGGPTQTHATISESTVVNASPDDCFSLVTGVNDPDLNNDQRGYQRHDGSCDLGAYEFNGASRQPGPNFEVNSKEDPFVKISGIPEILLPNGDGYCNLPPGDCTLREAVFEANRSTDASIISFASSLTIPPATVTLAGTQLPTVNTNITIQGAGLSVNGRIRAPTYFRSRIFDVETASLTIHDFKLINGAASTGGAIRLQEGTTLELSNSTLSSNTAVYSGGGIYAGANTTLTVNESTISGNLVFSQVRDCKLNYACGGGAITVVSGTANLTNSSLAGNTTLGIYSDGGAIHAVDAGLTISDSTLSGNTAGASGGAMWVTGTSITLLNSTLSANTLGFANSGSIFAGPNSTGQLIQSTISGSPVFGVTFLDATIDLVNSIIANSYYIDCVAYGGLITQSGVNLIEDGGAGCGLTPGPALLSGAPTLGPLADNGGLTLTHLPLPGSLAIDAGENAQIPAGVIFDQRGAGFTRIFNTTVDIGAVEFRPSDLTIFGDGFETGIVDPL